MKRRSFIAGLFGVSAVIAGLELLLPNRTFFLPPAGGWTGERWGRLPLMDRRGDLRTCERFYLQQYAKILNELLRQKAEPLSVRLAYVPVTPP